MALQNPAPDLLGILSCISLLLRLEPATGSLLEAFIGACIYEKGVALLKKCESNEKEYSLHGMVQMKTEEAVGMLRSEISPSTIGDTRGSCYDWLCSHFDTPNRIIPEKFYVT
ncbi:hypothetical protein GYMLUDRAFT_62908 [Collybiopsis luxurians FD-317 M1]|uniref:Uncharacterized protein n=1 Tax=Collybiopsis luxurians FD-317 M1 TaxID=944289 RepID=A0A0D0BJC6_9AGAR|nr:hypothetical protein GYMLUDRAFT_62908 [Collybiopsis luxurians FD-317 M1]